MIQIEKKYEKENLFNKSWNNFIENLKIFFEKKLNIFSFSIVVFLIFIAIFAPILAPYQYDLVNLQML